MHGDQHFALEAAASPGRTAGPRSLGELRRQQETSHTGIVRSPGEGGAGVRLESPGQGRDGHRGQGTSLVGNYSIGWARLPSPRPGDRPLWIRLLSCTMPHMLFWWPCRESHVTMEGSASLFPLLSLVLLWKKKKTSPSAEAMDACLIPSLSHLRH